MLKVSLKTLVGLASTTLLVTSLQAETANWPQWRGANRQDHSPDKGLLKSWPKDGPKQLWVYKNAGLGYGGPAIVDGKLYAMGSRDGDAHLISININDGSEAWATKMSEDYDNNWGDGPRGTPTVDGEHLYALSGDGTLLCAKLADGAKVWSVNLIDDFGGKMQSWGYTESVLVDGDHVICTPGGEKGSLLALNKKTGKKVWQSTDMTVNAQYASPIVVEHAGVRQYIQLFQKKFAGFQATDGKVLWESDFPKGRTAVIPTPIYHDGIVYITAGYKAGCKAIKLGPNHEVETLYENDVMSNHHGGVILVGDHLYGHSRGWTCQNIKTGEKVWEERKALNKGAIGYADGMLYCLEEKTGKVMLVEASPKEWKVKGEFTLDPQTELRKPSGRIWVHPVIIGGKLYLRDQELIHCYEVSGK